MKVKNWLLLNSVSVSGGRAIISEKDSIVRISDLNAFVNYSVEFSDIDLENIAWRFKHKSYQILVDPNQYKRVYVPIVSMGEVNGMVYLNNNNELKGIGRITYQIFDQDDNKVAEAMSESDGYLSYLGLKPGDYSVCLDSLQLQKLNYNVKPERHNFTIKKSEDGDIVNDLRFVLSNKTKIQPHQSSESDTPQNVKTGSE